MANNTILEVKELKKYFPKQKDLFGNVKLWLKAVDDVTFNLEAGKTIGVVGESGCGKTTLGRTILQLYDTTGGKSLYYGRKVEELLPKYYIETYPSTSWSRRDVIEDHIDEHIASIQLNLNYEITDIRVFQ